MYDDGTSSLYDRWIRGFPFKSSIAIRLAMVEEREGGVSFFRMRETAY
jgi:hypothetical protein